MSQIDKWIEVKGWWDEKSKARIRLFSEQYFEENKKLIIIDQNFYSYLRYQYFELPNWEDYAGYTKKPYIDYIARLDEQQKKYLFEIFLKNKECA